MLDLCTGNGSLAVLAAMAYPEVAVDAADISRRRARSRAHQRRRGTSSSDRITLLESDLFAACAARYDLILCNPPYVNAPAWRRCRPNTAPSPSWRWPAAPTAWTSIRRHLAEAPAHMSDDAVLVLEIGNERAHFEARVPAPRSGLARDQRGRRQVVLIERRAPRSLTRQGRCGSAERDRAAAAKIAP